MTAANNEPGFMGKPATSVDDLIAPPQVAPERLYHWAYSLPPSVMDQYHWRGTEADLHYGLCEPSLNDLTQFSRNPDRQVRDIVVQFIRVLGRLDKDGNLILSDEPILDADGRPQLGPDGKPKRYPQLFPVGYMEVEAWLGRIGAKGAQLVVGEFQACFQPSTAEGEAHRTSRRRG